MASWIRGNATAREGSVKIRSSGGMAILDETYHYIVETDNRYISYLDLIQTTGLPVVNVSVSPTGYGVCRTKSGNRRSEQPLLWDVQCDFSSEVDESQDNQDPSQDPEAWIPIYETKFERLQESVSKDRDDDPIANSAGQPFSVGLTLSRFIPIWEFYQLESASITDEQVIDRHETINSSEFKGRDAKTLLLTVVSSRIGFYYGARRRLTQYAIRYNKKKWTHKRLDTGTAYLDGTTLRPYLKKGQVINGGLDGSGAMVADGDPPAVLEFDIYPEISFSFLRI